jgi:hypothetical protein
VLPKFWQVGGTEDRVNRLAGSVCACDEIRISDYEPYPEAAIAASADSAS